jgi:hypothetical protein
VETLEVTRWLGCRNLRGHHCHGTRIEIPFETAISESSTDGNNKHRTGTGSSEPSTDRNFNNANGTGRSESGTDGTFNNHAGTSISGSSSGDTSGYTAAGRSDSIPDHSSSGHNNNDTAGDSSNSFDNSEHPSQPPVTGANCKIHGNSYNDCSRRESETVLQIGECRTRFY